MSTYNCQHCGMDTEHIAVAQPTEHGDIYATMCVLCRLCAAWNEHPRRLAGTREWKRARDAMLKRMRRATQKASA